MSSRSTVSGFSVGGFSGLVAHGGTSPSTTPRKRLASSASSHASDRLARMMGADAPESFVEQSGDEEGMCGISSQRSVSTGSSSYDGDNNDDDGEDEGEDSGRGEFSSKRRRVGDGESTTASVVSVQSSTRGARSVGRHSNVAEYRRLQAIKLRDARAGRMRAEDVFSAYRDEEESAFVGLMTSAQARKRSRRRLMRMSPSCISSFKRSTNSLVPPPPGMSPTPNSTSPM